MANRQMMEAAFKAADARLDRLAPLMATYEQDRLLDDGGKWSIRDCLCHVAATARVSGAGQRALARAREGAAPAAAAPAAPRPNIDEMNQRQIEERAGKSIEEIVAEAKAAHAASWADIVAMSDADLDTKAPTATVGGTILRFLEYHEGGQMDRIENALKVRTRWV